MWKALNAGQTIDKSIVDMAYDMHEAAYRQIWYGQQITLEVPARIDMVLAGLGRSLPDAERRRLIETFETMEVEVRPDPIDGAVEVIQRLADTFSEAARQLGCAFKDMLHIGDRDAKDVVGPQALGMKAILFTESRDEGSRETTKADAIAESYAELEAKIAELVDI